MYWDDQTIKDTKNNTNKKQDFQIINKNRSISL